MDTLPAPPREIDPAAAATFRAAATHAPFDGSIFRTLGITGLPGWKASMRAAASRLPTPACSTWSRFFVIGDPVPEPELIAALGGPEVLPALERAGLAARTSPTEWHCPFILTPASGMLAFSDPIGDPASVNPPDEYIMPVSGSTRFVDDLAVRTPCSLAVDLGCGQGYLTLRNLTHAQRCIATDINPRALAFARANVSLAGATGRAEFREGSFFEPLRDAAGLVDLLTCNPPFVIQPGAHTTTSVSPTEGDGMLEHLIRTAPSMLSDGGWATVIGIWEHSIPADWPSRPASWLEGSGCDALALQFRTYRPEEYLQGWFAPEVAAASAPGWRRLCERRRIGAVTFGAIILRKRTGPNWFRSLFTLINVRTGPASEQLRSFFRTQTALQSLASPADLLARRLRAAPGWRFDPAQQVRGAPPTPIPGLALPLQNAGATEPTIQSFDGKITARDTLAFLHQWNRLPMAPDHPSAATMLQSLAATGCLDILD